jgi:hypothetical protein
MGNESLDAMILIESDEFGYRQSLPAAGRAGVSNCPTATVSGRGVELTSDLSSEAMDSG